jgi:hypothetical protein
MEILGSSEQSSPDPRGNTSKTFFEPLPRGNKVETRFRLVSTLYPLCCHFPTRFSPEWKQSGNTFPLRKDLTSTEDEDYDADKTVSIQTDSIRRRDQEVEAQ